MRLRVFSILDFLSRKQKNAFNVFSLLLSFFKLSSWQIKFCGIRQRGEMFIVPHVNGRLQCQINHLQNWCSIFLCLKSSLILFQLFKIECAEILAKQLVMKNSSQFFVCNIVKLSAVALEFLFEFSTLKPFTCKFHSLLRVSSSEEIASYVSFRLPFLLRQNTINEIAFISTSLSLCGVMCPAASIQIAERGFFYLPLFYQLNSLPAKNSFRSCLLHSSKLLSRTHIVGAFSSVTTTTHNGLTRVISHSFFFTDFTICKTEKLEKISCMQCKMFELRDQHATDEILLLRNVRALRNGPNCCQGTVDVRTATTFTVQGRDR